MAQIKTNWAFFVSIFLVILMFGFVSAGFEKGDPDYNLETRYGPLDALKGWINISFNDEPTTALVSMEPSTEGITLLQLLQLNQASYECIPSDCGLNYGFVGGSGLEKTFTLDKDNSTLIGLVVSGGIVNDLTGFSLDISSNAGESIYSQLYIDVLNNKINEWKPYSVSGNFGEEIYGCYETGNASGKAEIVQQTRYCEKILLSPIPNVKLGANVYAVPGKGGYAEFRMDIYRSDYFNQGSCIANTTGTGKISCAPENFDVEEEHDYFVCISSADMNYNNNYEINYEENETCGFSGEYNEEFYLDFDIFLKAGRYNALGNFVLNNTEMENSGSYTNIEGNILGYIYDKYGGDCTLDCIIPLKFTSGINNQQITVSDLSLSYTTRIAETTHNIYLLDEIPARIFSDGFLKLDLDLAEFLVSEVYGSYNIALSLRGLKLLSEKIKVEKIADINGISPVKTASGFPTEFTASVILPEGITVSTYSWDFGDNKTGETTIEKIVHTYDEIGNYELKLTIKDSNAFSSSKTFSINVSSPEEVIETTLTEKQESLTRIKKQINEFDSFTQDQINSLLEMDKINDKLTQLQRSFSTANSNEEYTIIIEGLMELNIPESIVKDMAAESLIFYPLGENINLDILETIGSGSYDSNNREDYLLSIFGWNQEYLDTRFTFERISTKEDDSTEPLLSVFKIQINEKEFLEEDTYFILEKLGGLEFKQDYLQREEGNYYYITLENFPQTIIFSTTEDIDFIDLPLFISPGIRDLVVIKEYLGPEEERGEKWEGTMTLLIIILVLLLALVAFYFWQRKQGSKPTGPKQKRSRISDLLTEKILGKIEKRRPPHMFGRRPPPHGYYRGM